MSEKRRDRKNRILRSGESQRRDGRYVFKYMDKTGKPQFIYSWKLEKTDKIPGGKRNDLSLREKEKLIMKDIADDIVPRGGEMTVQQLVEKYLFQKTWLRISEFVGLTISDIDMQERTINVDHQLQRKCNMEYIIEETKTSCGTRKIPMSEDVYECFSRIIANRKKVKSEPMIDGKCGFLYLDKNNMPMVALHREKYFQHICQKYNRIYKIQMPKITPHVCRHTYLLLLRSEICKDMLKYARKKSKKLRIL